jgi:hypothetical protein
LHSDYRPTLGKFEYEKAFSRFVGAIVETTRRMRAAGDLNLTFTVALSFPTERDVLALAAMKK